MNFDFMVSWSLCSLGSSRRCSQLATLRAGPEFGAAAAAALRSGVAGILPARLAARQARDPECWVQRRRLRGGSAARMKAPDRRAEKFLAGARGQSARWSARAILSLLLVACSLHKITKLKAFAAE
jgi:hypothetical protein